jgi:hypothetical protein
MQPRHIGTVFVKKGIMKSLVIVALVTGVVLGVYAQESETRSVSSFRGVKVAEGIDAYLKKGSKEEARVEVTGTRLSNVITEVSGGYLKIHMSEGTHRDRHVKVYVTYLAINALTASSGASAYHEGILKAENLELRASSGGNVELKVEANSIEAGASSAGEVVLEGKAKTVDLDASSGGEVDAYNLTSDKARTEASSGGEVKVTVTQELEARASSGGSIRYRGNPERSNTNASSGGSVRKSN